MRIIRLFALFVGCSTLLACTTLETEISGAPVDGYSLVDPLQVSSAKYEADYQACAALANQNLTDVSRKAIGIVSGAADKASMGIVGSRQESTTSRMAVLKKCLTGRGYQILR